MGILLCVLMSAAVCGAAEFDIDGPTILLRRMQYCGSCGVGLLVTKVSAGSLVRCPECGDEQPRLADKFLLTRLYQVCPACSSPLDPQGRHAGDNVKCGECGLNQTITADAVRRYDSGLGYVPGQPPGSKPKQPPSPPVLAAKPDPEQPVFVPPPPEEKRPVFPEQPPVGIEPPAWFEAASTEKSDTDIANAQTQTPSLLSETPILPARPEAVKEPEPATQGVLDVPAVTAEQFGSAKNTAAKSFTNPGVVSRSRRSAATVNGRPIYPEEVDRLTKQVLERSRRNLGKVAETAEGREILARKEAQARTEALDFLIDRELILQEAERIGYEPDRDEIGRRLTILRSMLSGTGLDPQREARREAMVDGMRRHVSSRPVTVSPEDVREYYHAHKDEMLMPRRVAVKTLVIFRDRAGRPDARNADVIADDLAEMFELGARFDDIVRDRGEFPPPGAFGATGETPLVPDAYYAGPVRKELASAASGAIIGPIGLHGSVVFCKVTQVQPAKPMPFLEVEKDIRMSLEARAAEKAINLWMENLRRSAEINRR